MSSDSARDLYWLGVYLTQRGVSPELVRLCEEKLVVQEGFWSPLLLMRVNFQAPFFDRFLLNKLGITALGLCEALSILHKDLICALDNQKRLASNNGPTNAARAAAQIVCPETLTDGVKVATKASWVRMFLEANNVPQELVTHCEEQLVCQAGFGSPLTLARTSDQVFNRRYLNSLGINVLGVREALLALHADLQDVFNKHAPYFYQASNGAEDAARAAVNVVLPGYFENNDNSSSNNSNNSGSGKKRSFAELTAQSGAGVTNDSVNALK